MMTENREAQRQIIYHDSLMMKVETLNLILSRKVLLIVDQDDMELDQKSDRDDGHSTGPDYALDDNVNYDSVYDGNDMELDDNNNDDDDNDDPDYSYSKLSTSKSPRGSHSKSSTKYLKTNDSVKTHKCPCCNQSFINSANLKRHYRVIHQQIKPYYCKWPKCDHMSGRPDNMVQHIVVKHLHGSNKGFEPEVRNNAEFFVGKRKLSQSKDFVIPVVKSLRKSGSQKRKFTNKSLIGSYYKCSAKQSSNLCDDESEILNNDTTDPTPVKCPKCAKTFTGKHKILRHYRAVHQEWKPYYCRWPKCNFVGAVSDLVVGHAYMKHFNSQNRQKAKKYVGKRDETQPRDPVLEQIDSILFGTDGTGLARSECPQCGRSLSTGYLRIHLRTHKNPGFRCNWPKCGFFYSLLSEAKKHVCSDHLHVDSANSTETNQHLLKVAITGKSTKVISHSIYSIEGKLNNIDNHDDEVSDSIDVEESSPNSTDHHSQPTTSGYHLSSTTNLQATSNESDSSEIESDDNENEGNSHKSAEANTNQSSFDCPKCESSFVSKYLLVRHYRGIHQEWKPYYCRWPKCTFVAGVQDYVVKHADRKHFNENNRRKARKYVAKREGTPPRDSVLERIIEMKYAGDYRNANLNEDDDESNLKSTTFNLNCPKCNRNFLTRSQFMQHFRTHANSGFRCTWHNCGAFYSQYQFAKKNLLTEHFKDKLVNEIQITKHLVKVDSSLDKQNRDYEQ